MLAGVGVVGGMFVKLHPACLVVKMASDSSLQWWTRVRGEIKSVPAACGLEACADLEVVPEQHRVSVHF